MFKKDKKRTPRKSGYTELLRHQLDQIREFPEPIDRLEIVAQLNRARAICVHSSNSWLEWLNNYAKMNSFTEEQLMKMRDFWINLAVMMGEFDISITEEAIEREEAKRRDPIEETQGMWV